jgi:hypothetical protein
MKVRVDDKRLRGIYLRPETHFYTDFTMAGQDAYAFVAFLAYFMEIMQD